MTDYKRGQKVAVLNRTYSGKLILEGYARVVEDGLSDEMLYVHFIGKDGKLDPCGPVKRFIQQEAQADPDQYVRDRRAEEELARTLRGEERAS